VRGWGWAALAVGLAAAGGGWWLGWTELIVPGVSVTVIFIAGILAALGSANWDVSLDVVHRRVPVGSDPGAKVVVVNRGRRRVTVRGLAVPVGSSLVSLKVGTLAPGGITVADLQVATKRREVLKIGPAMAFRGDPFGLVSRTWTWGGQLDVAVYPATVAVPLTIAGLAKDIEGLPTGQPSEADISFHALREYHHGDDVRSIHWRSSARLGQLMVRQSEDTRRVQVALVVSTDRDEYASPADFELAVSAYTSIGLAQLAESGDLAVVAKGGMLPVAKAGRGSLLDQAAAIKLGSGGSLAKAAARARSQAPGATLAVLVTGTTLSQAELRRIAWFLPREAVTLAVRCEVGSELSVSRVGRLSLLTLGQLEDLPKVLRRLGPR
jgi:uncharacterized protein (DUF58 family)